ncbi:oligosaccharide flippase family protein [Butyrivibrio fibrisolvens]|uniref:lipopolysaccharide biosynthesis protein n=1 Tax=Pseudobutyrivibrio ruminis TaxID=46206 RepID=UPI000416323B|nr:oligosaccharide flippase family protein [Pseudobutyrivibrio ruminis]MDC7278805.1 oligosaccharide flippase family protein [Butyrivibrio fibrisolvens]
MRNKSGYLIKNTIIFTISSFATKFLSFLLVPLYTSVLTTSEYGIADLISTTSILMIYIFSLNISDAVLRFVVERLDEPIAILALSIEIVIGGGLISSIITIILCRFHLFSWPRYCYLFLIVMYFSSAINGILSNYARGLDRIKMVGVAGILGTTVTICSNLVCLLILKMHLLGYLLSILLGVIVVIVYYWIGLELPIGIQIFKNKCNKEIRDRMLFYSIPLVFSNVAWWVNGAFDRYCITYMIGVDENGIYSVASKIPLIIATINGVFGQAWSLSAIKDVSENDEDGFFSNTYNLYNCLLVGLASCLICFNIPLSKLLFSKDFFAAWQYSSILVISTIFNALSVFLGGAFIKTMKTDIYAKSTILATIINVILNIILINIIGTIGAAVSTAISFLVIWGTRYVMAKKYVEMKVYFAKHMFSYGILIIQIGVEHLVGKYSNYQICFLGIIIIIYWREIKKIIGFLYSVILQKTKNNLLK